MKTENKKSVFELRKKVHFIMASLSICQLGICQPNNGHVTVNHGVNATLSSGTYVSGDPGFVMAGYVQTVIGGAFNFYVDKVDIDGQFNASPGEFGTGYSITTGGLTCVVAPQNQELNCYGVSIIETYSAPTQYALTSAFDSGCLFLGLNNTGASTISAFLTFPVAATSPSKPLITEHAAHNGKYYVCGSYLLGGIRYMYVFSIDITGTLLWSNTYDLGAGTRIEPRAFVESGFYSSGPALAIVGLVDDASTTAEDGFLMVLDDGTNGTVILFNKYDSGGNFNEHFSSISLSGASSGYIVGGQTLSTGNNGTAWMTSLHSSGTINWSSQIECTSDGTAGDVVGVVERYSNFYSATEYHGITTSAVGMINIKLESNGAAFSLGGDNEFVYDMGWGFSEPAAMSFLNTATDPNEGLHFFGTAAATSGPGDFYLVQGCFNGAAGGSILYQNLTTLTAVANFPGNVGALNANTTTGLSLCANWSLSMGNSSSTANQWGYVPTAYPTSPFIGNNNRHLATGIANATNEKLSSPSVFPNPATDKIRISFNTEPSEKITITLKDLSGRPIYNFEPKDVKSGENIFEINLSDLHLANGMYLLQSEINGATFTEKLTVIND